MSSLARLSDVDTVAVFVNDAEHALRLIGPLHASRPDTRWVFVACAPRQTHRTGKWTSHQRREQWRERWSQPVFERLRAGLPGARTESRIASRPVLETTGALQAEFGAGLRLLDARRASADAPVEAAQAARQTAPGPAWSLLWILGAGLGAMLGLAD